MLIPPLLWIVGYVDNPETVFPVTPIEIGLEDLVPPDNLPQEYFPIGVNVFPAPTIPVVLVLESILQVKDSYMCIYINRRIRPTRDIINIINKNCSDTNSFRIRIID